MLAEIFEVELIEVNNIYYKDLISTLAKKLK